MATSKKNLQLSPDNLCPKNLPFLQMKVMLGIGHFSYQKSISTSCAIFILTDKQRCGEEKGDGNTKTIPFS